jgi:hypothetical protein
MNLMIQKTKLPMLLSKSQKPLELQNQLSSPQLTFTTPKVNRVNFAPREVNTEKPAPRPYRPLPVSRKIPLAERKAKMREEKKKLLELRSEKEKENEKTARGWNEEDEEPGFIPIHRRGLISPGRIAEIQAQRAELERQQREDEEARIAAEDHARVRVFSVPDATSDDEGENEAGNTSSSEDAAPTLVCPPRPERDWQNDDRWGFSTGYTKGKRYSRRLYCQPAQKLTTYKPLPVRYGVMHGPERYVPLTLEVAQWIEEDEAWVKLAWDIDNGKATQFDLDQYEAMLRQNQEALEEERKVEAEAAANPPPPPRPANATLPKPAFTNKHAPKTPSALRHAERAYSSPVDENPDEESDRGPTELVVGEDLVVLASEATVRPPLQDLPIPNNSDVVNLPDWLKQIS